jgi:hypothetical protein
MSRPFRARRARGEFVLATNVDILFAEELMRFLASGRLRKGCLYRVNRYDVTADVPAEAPIEEQLRFCGKHVMRKCLRQGTWDLRTGELHRIYSPLYFIRGPFHRFLVRLRPILWHVQLFREHYRFYSKRARLHTNACGDFTLMAKDHWFQLRGYPELEMFSFHLDSLLCYMAHHIGIQEVLLRAPIFHIEHSGGWTPAVERDQSLVRRLEQARIPRVTNEQFFGWTAQMLKENRALTFNDEHWGLARETLPEETV